MINNTVSVWVSIEILKEYKRKKDVKQVDDHSDKQTEFIPT